MKYGAFFLPLPLMIALADPAFALENRHVVVRTTVCEEGFSCQTARLRVWDGDTFIVDRSGLEPEKIRIQNIDAPEIEGRCTFEADLAQRSKNRLGALLASGKVAVHPTKLDRYGRRLATVTGAAGDVGEALISEHLARRWDGARHPWCGTAFDNNG